MREKTRQFWIRQGAEPFVFVPQGIAKLNGLSEVHCFVTPGQAQAMGAVNIRLSNHKTGHPSKFHLVANWTTKGLI